MNTFLNTSFNFKGKKTVDHILEIPRLVVFGVLNVLNAKLQNYIEEEKRYLWKTT